MGPNPEHLEILYQGVEKWNRWREEHPSLQVDLAHADLRGAVLHEVNFKNAFLFEADLRGVDLRGADLVAADLCRAWLDGANLAEWHVTSNFRVEANLSSADLTKASLRDVNFSGAELIATNFNGADVRGANFNVAIFLETVFADVDLSVVNGLENTLHMGRSTIGLDTLYRSQGKIPEVFLRSCGVPEAFITFAKSLVNSPIEFYSCFISYSSRNQDFAERLYTDLQSKGVRCWYAPEDLKIGDRFRIRIDESIQAHDKLLLILSKDSVESQWVEKEVETAMERERHQGRNSVVLFPIKLDDAILDEKKGWAADIRRTRHIGDFSGWKNQDEYRKAFDRLLRDLRAGSQRQ